MVSIPLLLQERRSDTDNLRLSREVILQARSRNSGMVHDTHVLHIQNCNGLYTMDSSITVLKITLACYQTLSAIWVNTDLS